MLKRLSEVLDGLLILLKNTVNIAPFPQRLRLVASLLNDLAQELDSLLMPALSLNLNGFLIELHDDSK